jgi:hypothetical protein
MYYTYHILEGIMKKLLALGFAGFLLTVLVPLGLFPVEVDWVSGNVTYSHMKGPWDELKVGIKLQAGDIIKTGMNSETTLLDDGGEIHILENSTFSISEIYEKEEQKSAFMLFLGRMKFKLARTAKKEPEIRTQTVNLAIRGTELQVGAGYDGSTLVLLEDGEVAVRGNRSELILSKGEGTQVAFGEEPSEKFEILTKVIDWDEWFSFSKESVKGNELSFLLKIHDRFREIESQIRDFETIRERMLAEKEELIRKRDELLEAGKKDEAAQYSREAGGKSKKAFHAIVNIRFLALSSIGLLDLAESTYNEAEDPSADLNEAYVNIKQIYQWIENKYIKEGDRERLEKQASKKRGCLKPY